MAVNNSCRRHRAGVLALLILVLGTSGRAQLAGGDFELRESAMTAGGGQAQQQQFEVHGSIGQAHTEKSTGGPYQLFSGLWTPDDTDFLFRDSWED